MPATPIANRLSWRCAQRHEQHERLATNADECDSARRVRYLRAPESDGPSRKSISRSTGLAWQLHAVAYDQEKKRPLSKSVLSLFVSTHYIPSKTGKLSDHCDCKCPAGDDVRKRKVDGDINPQTGRVRPCAPKFALASPCIRHTISCNARLTLHANHRQSKVLRALCDARGGSIPEWGKLLRTVEATGRGGKRLSDERRTAFPRLRWGETGGPPLARQGKEARNRQKE